MEPLKVKVILGSTREGRYGEKPATWVLGELSKHADITTELLDLRDYPMPFFKEPIGPSAITTPYTNEAVVRFTAKIAEADAFIIIAAEYNHGYTAVLKNALDYVYKQWNSKAVGFVGYGSMGGARAIEQLREVAVELQMAPIRQAVHIPVDVYLATVKEAKPDAALFAPLQQATDKMIGQLLWWGRTLKSARAAS